MLPIADLAVGGRGLPWTVRNAALGLREAFYRFDQLKTQKKPAAPALASVTLAIAGAPVTLQAQAALKALRPPPIIPIRSFLFMTSKLSCNFRTSLLK